MASARHSLGVTVFPVMPFAVPLACCQVLAMGLIASHNREFASLIAVLHREGYTVIPGRGVLARMGEPGVLFAAGLFFTATVGPMLAAWGTLIGDVISRRRRWSVALPAVGLLAVPSLFTVRAGMSWWAVALVVAVPLAGAAGRLLQTFNHPPAPFRLPAPAGLALTLAVLVGLGATWGGHLPYRIRALMLHSRAGATLAQAYYRYALYPAQALKSPQQRLINAYALTGDTGSVRAAWVRERLRRFAYLPVSRKSPQTVRVDLSKDGILTLHDYTGRGLRVGYEAFMGDTDGTLTAFSRRVDGYARVRVMARWGLLYGLPLSLFCGLWWLLNWIRRGAGRRRWVRWAALGAGGMAAWGVLTMLSPPGGGQALSNYRLALRLGNEAPSTARPALSRLARNPNLLVAGTAAAGLGQHPDPLSRRAALAVIARSGSWYVQWKAYDGLLRGGWHP